MSGPKVIRIITRDETIEICQNYLARLDAAIASWKKVGERNTTIDSADIAAVMRRRDTFHKLLANERFVELQSAVPVEIASLKTDTQDRLVKAASAKVETDRATRRTATTAATLLNKLKEANYPVSAALRQRLENAARGDAGAESAISEAFRMLQPPPDTNALSARQRELASKLGAGGKPMTLAEWCVANELHTDPAIDQIEERIAQLRAIGGASAAAPFEQRLAAVAREDSQARRALLTDSLGVDLVIATRAQSEAVSLAEELGELAAELARLDTAQARSLIGEIEQALSPRRVQATTDLMARASGYIAGEMKARAVAARRRAVLQGLAGLGYEVTEGLSTAWVKDGRIVLQKSANPDYGVEIGGGADADRFQVRAVGFGSGGAARDTARDRDMETLWCNDFARLQEMVGKAGDFIAIERALAVGEAPMKIIERVGTDDTHPAGAGVRASTRRMA